MLADVLPVWLQWFSSFAGILSSIGVIIAFVQLRASSKQFQAQLKLTQEQFNVLNQGFVKILMTQFFVPETDADSGGSKSGALDPMANYIGGQVMVTLENVGNLPVRIFFRQFAVFFNEKEFHVTPTAALEQCNDILHPKTSGDYYLASFLFNKDKTSLNLPGIAGLKISYRFLIEYYDYNDIEKKIKTIDRETKLDGSTIFNVHIYDKI